MEHRIQITRFLYKFEIYISGMKKVGEDHTFGICRALDYALSKNSTTLFTAVIGNRGSKDTSWNYITEHWNEFKDGNTTRYVHTD